MSAQSIESQIGTLLGLFDQLEYSPELSDTDFYSLVSHVRFLTSYAKMNKSKLLNTLKKLNQMFSKIEEGIDTEKKEATVHQIDELILHIETNDIGEHEHLKHFSLVANEALPEEYREVYNYIITIIFFTDELIEVKKTFGVFPRDGNLMTIVNDYTIPAWVSHFLWLGSRPEIDMDRTKSMFQAIQWALESVLNEIAMTRHSVRNDVEASKRVKKIIDTFRYTRTMMEV